MYNEYVYLLPSASRTADANSADFQNKWGSGGIFVVDITVANAGAITVNIQGHDRAGDKYYTILSSTSLSSTGTTVLRVYPGLTASPNATVNSILPDLIRVNVVAASGTMTYSVGASLVP